MKANLKPFKFTPILKSVLWGGEKIAPFKGLSTEQHNVGESWEISGVEGHESIVAEGKDTGLSIIELLRKYKSDLVGKAVYERFGNKFPLLVKIIDAKADLSVQVHPNDELAMKRHNCFGKTEMWYIIDADPGAKIYSGLNRHITPDEFDSLVARKKIMDVVAQHETHPGDLFYLPPGRIHSIGAGNLLAEIQETSDITYRVYDFDRRDAMGNKRELHNDLAREAIDYETYDGYKIPSPKDTDGINELIKCDCFDTRRLIVNGSFHLDVPDTFIIVMNLQGNVTITDNNGNITTMHRGETILVPAAINTLDIAGNTRLLLATA
jgi:mannose-6-phosphate isomerase